MGWFAELQRAYEHEGIHQFLLHGNIRDLFPARKAGPAQDLDRYLLERLGQFQVVLSLDIGEGIEVHRGADHLQAWGDLPRLRERGRSTRELVDRLHHLFTFWHNLEQTTGQSAPAVALLVRDAHLLFPADGGANFDLAAAASLVRDWARPRFAFTLLTGLLTESLSQLHPLVRNNPFARAIAIGLPSHGELLAWLEREAARFPRALAEYAGDRLGELANLLQGLTLHAAGSLLARSEGLGERLRPAEVFVHRRRRVERASNGLISFLDPDRTLEDYHTSHRAILDLLANDMRLLRAGQRRAIPMGYLFCGPVGTGKTYLAECLAGSAGIPAITLKNFRDRWVGSSETNLETIFRQIEGLGQCLVFIDEADQVLGRRQSDSSGGGEVSSRLYAMFAQFMADPDNRGKVVWILATSRPDQLEVDLKRPGRIDVKIPIFPTLEADEGYALIRALFRRVDIALPRKLPKGLEVPTLLTPGAVSTLAAAAYKQRCLHPKLGGTTILRRLLAGYLPPVDPAVLRRQMDLAIAEVSDLQLLPPALRPER